jgi:hypothetical protein
LIWSDEHGLSNWESWLLNFSRGTIVSAFIRMPGNNFLTATRETMSQTSKDDFVEGTPDQLQTTEGTIRFTVDMPESMHRELSILAAKLGKRKVVLVRQAIAQLLQDRTSP